MHIAAYAYIATSIAIHTSIATYTCPLNPTDIIKTFGDQELGHTWLCQRLAYSLLRDH